eukprot:766312-Hanusia_phi.AAC.2
MLFSSCFTQKSKHPPWMTEKHFCKKRLHFIFPVLQLMKGQGLTDEEIDEAVRVAQPRLDQMSKAQAVPKTPSPTLQGSTATQPSRTALNSSFSSRVAQGCNLVWSLGSVHSRAGDDLPPVTSIQPPSTGASW